MVNTSGGPPCERPAPGTGSGPSDRANDDTNHNRSVPEWRRRRAASRRLAILDCGRADPWQHPEIPMTEHQAEAWQRTVAHLTAAGFRAIIPADVLEVLS